MSDPIAEESWMLKGDESPWPRKVYAPVKIIEVLNGWVRYNLNSIFPDERMKIEHFLGLYEKVQE